MQKTTLETFFSGKFLRIPAYQRDYAWDQRNIDELWTDIQESLDIGTSHYIGTFILAQKPGHECHDLVDGQQRLTTLTMLLSSLISRLPTTERLRIVAEDKYIHNGDKRRLTLLGSNDEFFRAILSGSHPEAATQSQRRLLQGFGRVEALVTELAQQNGAIPRWIDGIGRLNVMEFVEDNEGNAIRIFQTVNDRGKPLSVLEKIKSFLIYASSKYLGGRLDEALNDRFGRVFHAYDAIKEIAQEPRLGVSLISQRKFTEDSILRYHYIAYPGEQHDYGITPEGILNDYLKPQVKSYVADSKTTPNSLDSLGLLIDDYSKDLAAFYEGFQDLLKQAQVDAKLYKLFTTLELSTYLYPLAIRLHMRGLLDEVAGTTPPLTFRDMLEIADVRVYKTRGTSPEKDVAILARDAAQYSAAVLAAGMRGFIAKFMWDEEFKTRLRGNVYEENEGTRHLLLEYDEHVRTQQSMPVLSVAELRALRGKGITIDHVLAQEPTFTFPGRGFQDSTAYGSQLHRLGNLTLVEKQINSSAQQKSPEQKASADSLYKDCGFASTRQLAAAIHTRGSPFTSDHVDERTINMMNFCLTRWPLWK